MRRTRLGVALLAVGACAFPAALVLRSPALAMVGLLLLALVLGQRPPPVEIRVRREVPAEVVVVGEPFEVRTIVEDALRGNVALEEDAPAAIEVIERVVERRPGLATIRLRAVARAPGLVAWDAVLVRHQDAWGVTEETMRMPLFDAIRVAPEKELLSQGRRAAAHVKADTRVKSARGHDREPEVERLREYQAGDRLRDIAWSQVSKLGKLITRELRRETTLPLVLLVDATPTMRRGARPKLGTAARAALTVVAAGHARGVGVGLVAWSENGVEAQVRVSSARRILAEAVAKLAALPPALPHVVAASTTRARVEARLTTEERAFLAAVNVFSATAGVTPTEAAFAALARVASQPSTIVAFVDGEERPELVAVLLARLKARGHRVTLVAPASGPHAYRQGEVDGEAVAALVRWRRHRAEVTALAARYGAPFLSLGPSLSDADVEGVVRSSA